MEVETLSPISVSAEVKKYTLVGDDIYVKRYTNDTIPDWYRNLIANLIANDATVTTINDAIAYLESLPAGFNQMITSLQNQDEIIETFLTSLIAKDGDKSAAISELQTTKVDAVSAQAIALSTIATYFADGTASAWFNTKISTLASQTAANASSISMLVASVDDAEARIIQSYTVYVDANLSYDVKVYSTNGSMFKNGVIDTVLSAKVFKGKDDITSTLAAGLFTWARVSADSLTDPMWNATKIGVGSVLHITTADVFSKAVFSCVVTLT
jgi:hypothetical protein